MWNLDPDASYVYYCANETIHGEHNWFKGFTLYFTMLLSGLYLNLCSVGLIFYTKKCTEFFLLSYQS